MTNGESFSALHTAELREFFGGDPVESDASDGFCAYEMRDRLGVTLRLSFNLYERSVQTELRLGESVMVSVSQEGATAMRRDGALLRCDFRSVGTKTTLSIDTRDYIRVDWATLRVQ